MSYDTANCYPVFSITNHRILDLRKKKKGKNGSLVTKSEVQETNEDPDVIRSEIGEMRQSVVSMSVGQPKTATRIVKEWLEDDVVPEPEPPPEEPEEEDSGKKKKKKK